MPEKPSSSCPAPQDSLWRDAGLAGLKPSVTPQRGPEAAAGAEGEQLDVGGASHRAPHPKGSSPSSGLQPAAAHLYVRLKLTLRAVHGAGEGAVSCDTRGAEAEGGSETVLHTDLGLAFGVWGTGATDSLPTTRSSSLSSAVCLL